MPPSQIFNKIGQNILNNFTGRDLLKDGDTSENRCGCPDGNLDEGHRSEDHVLEVGVGTRGRIAPVVGPPNRQQEQVDGVRRNAVVVSNC